MFTLCQDRIERTQFMVALRYAATVAGSQSVILLTMRADFLTRATEYKPLAELLSSHQFLIGPMDRDELRRACEEPAHRVGLTFEDGLTDAIFLQANVMSAFLRAHRRGRVSRTEAEGAIRDLIALPLVTFDVTPILVRAFEIAQQHNQRSYDCIYTALAEQEGMEF